MGGSTGYGSIGTQAVDATSPHEVSGASVGTEVVSAQRSEYSQCFARQDGSSYCFGYGYAGDGSAYNSGNYQAEPKAVSGVSTASALACGYAHNCAVLSSGAVKCWGYNNYGQLGNNDTGNDSTTPVEPTGLSSGVRSIATAQYSTCALMSGGDAVKCWGYDVSGQLGANSPGDQAEPYSSSALVP
jgi:alpha-tubulin suppressor-like RCC1 family protein